MGKRGNRVQVILECTEHRKKGFKGVSRYITSKNRRVGRLTLMKYNAIIKEYTKHKEIK